MKSNSICWTLLIVFVIFVTSVAPVFSQGPDNDPLGVYARQTANAAAMNAQNAAMAATAYAVATRQAFSVQQTVSALSYQQTVNAQNAQAQATAQAQSARGTEQAQSAAATRAINESNVVATQQAINAEKAILSAYATATQQAQRAGETITAQAVSASATQAAVAPTQTLMAVRVIVAQEKENRDRVVSDVLDLIWKIVPIVVIALVLWGLYLVIHGIGARANTIRDASGMPATMLPNIGGMVVFMPGRAGAPVIEVNSAGLASRVSDWLGRRKATNVTQHGMLPDVTRRDQARAFAHAMGQGGRHNSASGWNGGASDLFDESASPESRIAVVEKPEEIIEGEFWQVLDQDWAKEE